FAVATDRDAERLHEGTAIRAAVAGSVVEMAAPETLWAVVAMARSRREQRDARVAMTTVERTTPMSCLAVALVARHGNASGQSRTETAPRVPATGANRSGDGQRDSHRG